MGLGIVLLIGGLVIIAGLWVWSRQRRDIGHIATAEQQMVMSLPLASNDDAVIVSKEHGQLVYINERARNWLGMNGGDPNLEFIANLAQPADSFLELFAGEGQASFQLGQRWVEASSHTIPTGAETRTVVVMRELTANAAHPDALDLSLAMHVINEIGETVNASMSVQQVLQALLTMVTKALPAHAGEICLWDAPSKTLKPQGWAGDAGYLLVLSEHGGAYKLGEGITGWIALHRKPALVSNIYDPTAVQPKLKSTYKSFLGVPLMLGDRFIGTFELAHTQVDRFGQPDMALLQAVSKQLAIAIYNAELYGQQAQRINDMANLQDITRQEEIVTDTRAVYKLLNERLARLVNAQISGVFLYDENRRALVPELPFFGLPDTVAQNTIILLPEDSPQRDIWERQPYWVTNDAQDEPLVEALGLRGLFSVAGIKNTAMIPMEIGNQRIGMVQISNKQAMGGFTPQDIQDMRMLVAQAAIVVENLRLYQREQRRDTELSGLQEITHAIGALSQEGEFYSDITERIAKLMNIEMVGILLYDEQKHRLVSQLPFYGVDNDLIRDYHINLQPGTPLYDVWEEVEFWYTNRVQADALVYAAGLGDFAAQMGVQKTMLAALAVGGRRLGVVQVSNKRNGGDFTDKDAQLLLIFATQAAAIIENARLYRDVQRTAQDANRLRNIAELAGAILTNEDSFTPVMAEISQLTGSPLVFINVLDPQTGSLITYPRWTYGDELAEPIVYDLYSKGFEHSVAMSHRPFLSNDVPNDKRVLPGYATACEKFGITRTVMVAVVVGDRSLGELGVANRPEGYTEADIDLLNAVAAQIAATIERLRLYEAAGQNLNRRLQELDAISQISNELTQTLDLEPVLDTIRHQAARATRADGSTIALLKPVAQWQYPNAPERLQRLGDADLIPGLADIEVEAIGRGSETITISDYTTAELKPLPDEARSAVAVAFLFEDEVVGVIHLYHNRPNHFDERATAFLMTLAAKASLGFGNNKRYRDQLERSTRLRRRVEQLNQIFELGQMLQTNVDQVTMLEAILYSIQQSVGYDTGIVALVDEDAGVLRRVAQVGMPLDVFEQSKSETLPVADVQAILADTSYQISESYFLPAERGREWGSSKLGALRADFPGRRPLPEPVDNKSWRGGDMLLVALTAPGGNLLGVISLDRPQDNLRPDRGTMEVLEIFSHQAAATIENIRLYLASLQSAEQEARLNEMMEAITGTLNTEEIVEAAAYGALRLVPFTQMTVALQDREKTGFDLLKVTFGGDNSLVVTKDHTPSDENSVLARTFRDGQDHLYHVGTPDSAGYNDLSSWHTHGERTSLIVPLGSGGQSIGAIHLGSDLEQASGFNEFRPLLKRMANLTAVAIENARLFNEALNLQTFNESIVESIQQGIVVLDKSGRLLSINEFMIARYGWNEKEALRQDLFAYRPNLKEYLYDDVTAVLETGRPRERIGQSSYQDSGRLLVRNFYSYPLKTGDSVRGAVILVEDVTERHLLEKDLEKRANQLAVLTEVSSRITASLNREEVITLALDEIGRVIQHDTMTLWSRDGDMLDLEGSNGFNDEVAMVADDDAHVNFGEHERLREVVETQRPFSISQLQGFDYLPGDEGAKSWLGVPLVNQGNVVGVIALAKKEHHAFDQQAEQAAFAFANQVAIALANADLYTESQYRTERLSLLNRVSVALAQSLDSENILEVALQEIASTMGAPQARALVYDRELNIGRVIVAYPRGDEPPDEVITLGDSPTSQLLRREVSPIIYEDVAALKKNDSIRKELEPREIKAYALIPMIVGGQVIGAFELEIRSGPRYFRPEQIELALVIANQAAIAVQNTNLLETTLLRTRELETLLEAAQATSLTLDLNEAYRSVADLILHALDMDNCAVMIWDNVEGVVEVQLDANKYGDEHAVARGTQYNLRQYPSKLKSLEDREIIAIRASEAEADPTELTEVRARGDALRVLVPLVVRDQAIGLIQAGLKTPHRAFSHREMRLAQALGAQAAIAIQNARLSTETAALVEEGFIINNLSQAISSTLTIEDMVMIVRDQVPRVTDAEEMYLALYEPETQAITFPMAVRRGDDFDIPMRPLNTDEVSFILKHRRSLSLGGGNWSSDDMRRNLGITNGEGEAKSYLGVPVASGDQVLGVLALRDTRHARAFGINDERLLTTVGTQLGAAIQNARLFKQVSSFAEELNQRVKERTLELQKERDRIDTLYRITSELARTLDMDRVLKRALEMVASAVLADDGVIMLIDPLSDRLATRAALRVQYGDTPDPEAEHPANNLASWVLQHARVVMVDDLRKEDYWDATVPGAEEYRSALAVLLETGDDPQGVMVLLSKQPNAFNEPQLKLVNAAANQVASAINNADLYHLIRDQAERLGKLLRQEQEEAEKNSAIVEGIADGVMLADSDGVIIQFNTAAERILELERDQVVGQSLFKLTGLFGGSASQWAQAVEGWTNNPESYPAGSFLAETLDLGNRVVSVHLSPVHIGERFLGTVSVFRDISKEVEVDRIKSEFVSNVSHELRTPMTSIKGFADLMLMGVAGEVNDPQKSFLLKIKSNADRLSQLVDDLLNISKIDAGEKLNVEWVDLVELIPMVVQQVESRMENEEKEMQVTVEVADGLPTVQGDPHKITQIITSIVDNAFSYTYPGGSITVTAAQQPDERHVLIAVQDTGIGIPDEFRSRIWGRFERYDDHALVMDVSGTGLGLSIVKELVQLHNGTIWFESELGQGTTFFVELPIEQPVEVAA